MKHDQVKQEQELPVIKLGNKFEAGPYHFALDLDAFFNHALQVDGAESTVQVVLKRLVQEKVTDADVWIGEAKFTTEEGTIHVRSEKGSGAMSTLVRLADLLRGRINPSKSTFYYYGHDVCFDGPQEVFEFFVVCDDKIARERFVLFTDDFRILRKYSEANAIWRSHPYLDDASTIYWYRKFYQETRMGQLTALRPDNPTLYFMPRNLPSTDWAKADRNLTIQFWIYAVLLGLGWFFFMPEHKLLYAAMLLFGLLVLDKMSRIHQACIMAALKPSGEGPQ